MNKMILWSVFIACLIGSCQSRKEQKYVPVAHRDYDMNELFIGNTGTDDRPV
ncbi:MAG: hypothetical protein LBT83_08680 [Tannerella sp.]|jgi:hypothetical protein|nr:hypothetical protein [Tannerella sp.]